MDPSQQQSDPDDHPTAFEVASYDEAIGLPEADLESLEQAARAVRQEYRDCSKWKKLSCEKVSLVAESQRGVVHVVHVDGAIDFDWTWEGAVAFRPRSEAGLIDRREFADPETVEQAALWSGEILEVDQQTRCLFVSLDNPEVTPVPGEFCVRPFEFLASLNTIYNGDFGPASRGWRSVSIKSVGPSHYFNHIRRSKSNCKRWEIIWSTC